MSEQTPCAFTAASFNKYLAEHKLMAARCTSCGALHLPPRAVCPQCHSTALEWHETSGRGKLAAFTSVYVAPTAMIAEGHGRDNPYACGVVELEEGVKISARLLGLDATKPDVGWIGMPLAVEFLDRGEEDQRRTALAFRPA